MTIRFLASSVVNSIENRRSKIENTRWLWLSLAVIVLDQITKYTAVVLLDPYQPVAVLPSVNLTLMFNTGAAFSVLNDASGWQRWFFIVLAVTVSAALVHWLRRMPPRPIWPPLALTLILGGALGNVIDRVVRARVVDFVDVYYGQWHWPAFNLADSAITVGATLLVIDALFSSKKHSQADAKGSHG
jgi:signal peptidase II